MISTQHPRALALDFGRVLTLDQDQTQFEGLLLQTGIPAGVFREAWGRGRLDYDRGDLTSRDYWARVLGPDLTPRTADFAEADFRSWTRPRTRLHDLTLRALDRGVPTAIVSNMPPGLGDRFVGLWPWLNRIPHRFFSGEMGVTKPDEAFYRQVLHRTGWDPAQVLFVDDSDLNIAGAARLGFQTLCFTGVPGDFDTIADWCGLR